MADDSPEFEQLVARLLPESRHKRQSALLRPLNYALIVISLIGLPFMIWPRIADVSSCTIVLGSLLINLLIAMLDRARLTGLASLLFSTWVNLGVISLVAVNLFYHHELTIGVLFASQLALSVILSGMLLGALFAFFFAALNSLTLVGLFWGYIALNNDLLTGTTSRNLATYAVPTSAFLMLIAIISWLNQRSLAKADERLEAARKRLIQDELTRRDLALARELQLRLFPPPPITSAALRIASRSQAARETSGDFYDFVELGEGRLGIVVADVMGKSVPAALMMALARVAIRSEARRHTAPAEVLRAANETICRDHTARQLITAFYALLDTQTMTMCFANAGHTYPILRRDQQLHEIELNGMPLGGRSESRYDEHSLQLEPGDQLFLISDGLVEERNAQREMFGYDRLESAILAADPIDPELALEMLWQAVVGFRGATEQDDDITLVVIQATPIPASPAQDEPPSSLHGVAQR